MAESTRSSSVISSGSGQVGASTSSWPSPPLLPSSYSDFFSSSSSSLVSSSPSGLGYIYPSLPLSPLPSLDLSPAPVTEVILDFVTASKEALVAFFKSSDSNGNVLTKLANELANNVQGGERFDGLNSAEEVCRFICSIRPQSVCEVSFFGHEKLVLTVVCVCMCC